MTFLVVMICYTSCDHNPKQPRQGMRNDLEQTDTTIDIVEETTLEAMPLDNETGIAFQIFEKIPQDDLDFKFRDKTYTCPEGCDRTLILYEETTIDGLSTDELTVTCFPHDDGGWVAVLCDYGCFDYCSYGLGKAYLYKDGELHEAPELIPLPPYKGEVLAPIFYAHYCDSTGLFAFVLGMEYDEFGESLISQETHYAWNGRRFVLDTELFCDMNALYEALFNDEEDQERQDYYQSWSFNISENHIHGAMNSLPAEFDAIKGTIEVQCYPLNEGGFRVYLFESTESDSEGVSKSLEAYDFIDNLLYWKDAELGLADDELVSVTMGEKTLQITKKTPDAIGSESFEFVWDGERMRK